MTLREEAEQANQEHRGGGTALPRWRLDISREVDALAKVAGPQPIVRDYLFTTRSSSVTIPIPANAIVNSVSVVPTQAFDGAGAAMQVSLVSGPVLLAAGDNRPSIVATWQSTAITEGGAADAVRLDWTKPVGATQGRLVVVVTLLPDTAP